MASNDDRAPLTPQMRPRTVTVRKIRLTQQNEAIFLRAIQLLGKTVISFRKSEYSMAVRDADCLRALVLLKNHGISAESGAT